MFALSPIEVSKMYKDATRKSVKWQVIEELGIELDRLPKPVRYDLSKLLNTMDG